MSSTPALTAEPASTPLSAALLADGYRQLFAGNPQPMWVYDRETLHFLAVNDAALRHYGYGREELLTQSVTALWAEEDVPLVKEQLTARASEQRQAMPARHHRKDGTIILVEIAFLDLPFDGRPARLMVAADVTKRLRAEERLRSSEERFKLVARATSDAIWDWNPQTGSLWWSDTFYSLFGYNPAETAPDIKWREERVHPDDAWRVLDGLAQTLAGTSDHWREEYRFRRKDGSWAQVIDRAYILRDTAGKAGRVVGGMTDITERKQLEAQYLRAQRMESIGSLAGGIAHDLNNVLAPILLSLELLQQQSVTPQHHRLIATIQSSARRGADLVRQVLSFARGVEGERVTLRIDRLLRELEQIAEETFPRNLQIETNAEPDLWPIAGDVTQIHQVLLNLLVNARDAMPEGGRLILNARNSAIDATFAATNPGVHPGQYVVVEVSDTGTGIPPEIRDRIFDPFFTTKAEGKGTGLGLATVHAVVKNHGGFIRLESEVGRGTTFRVHLPADPALRAAPEVPVKDDIPRGRGECLLVIDDEASIRSITQQTLEAFGYQVLLARDGAEGVAVYAQNQAKVDLILTDMAMPVLNGQATIQVLRHMNPQLRILATSGHSPDAHKAEIATLGVKHFLPKPYTAGTLLRALRFALDEPVEPDAR